MQDANRVLPGASPAAPAKRGRLNERQWADVRRAARLARKEGIGLKVHGVEIFCNAQKNKTRPCVGKQQKQQQQQKEKVGQQQQPTPQSTRDARRDERSAQRLLVFQKKKRKELLSQSSRVQTFLRQYRWNRMQLVWKESMQADSASSTSNQPMEA